MILLPAQEIVGAAGDSNGALSLPVAFMSTSWRDGNTRPACWHLQQVLKLLDRATLIRNLPMSCFLLEMNQALLICSQQIIDLC